MQWRQAFLLKLGEVEKGEKSRKKIGKNIVSHPESVRYTQHRQYRQCCAASLNAS